MTDFKVLSSLLEEKVQKFESQFGNLELFWKKHLQDDLHNMILEESFLSPDLKGLEDYEKLLTDGN